MDNNVVTVNRSKVSELKSQLLDKEYYWIKWNSASDWEVVKYDKSADRFKGTNGSLMRVEDCYKVSVLPCSNPDLSNSLEQRLASAVNTVSSTKERNEDMEVVLKDCKEVITQAHGNESESSMWSKLLKRIDFVLPK